MGFLGDVFSGKKDHLTTGTIVVECSCRSAEALPVSQGVGVFTASLGYQRVFGSNQRSPGCVTADIKTQCVE